MDDVHNIDGCSPIFREAYRLSAFDLHVACGGSTDSFILEEDEYYLDERVSILGWMPGGGIRAFIIYAASPFFYTDTDGEVLDVWVAAAWRRRGLGRSLAVEAFSHLRGRVGLEVHGKNTVSLLFWQTLSAENNWEIEKEAHLEAGETVWKLVITKYGGRHSRGCDDAHP